MRSRFTLFGQPLGWQDAALGALVLLLMALIFIPALAL